MTIRTLMEMLRDLRPTTEVRVTHPDGTLVDVTNSIPVYGVGFNPPLPNGAPEVVRQVILIT